LGHGLAQVPYQLYHENPDGSEHGWIFVEGKPSAGLIARRQREIALFNTPV